VQCSHHYRHYLYRSWLVALLTFYRFVDRKQIKETPYLECMKLMGAVRWEYCSTNHKCYLCCKICWYIINFLYLYFEIIHFLSPVQLACFNFLLRWATTALYSYSVTGKLHSFLCYPYWKITFFLMLSFFVFVLSTRYGKRTTQGILNDLWNALARYYLNNFADGTKQVICLFFV